MLGGAVDVRRRRVDHQHTAGGGGVDVDVVQADAGAGDDLELGRGGEHLGVHGGRRAHQQRVGLRHRGQQLLSVRTVDPADFYLVTQGGDGRLGQLVGDQYNGQTHAASLMGCNDGWRAGESQAWTSPSSAADPTAWPPPSSALGPVFRCRFSKPSRRWAAARAPCADPEFSGVSHDICSAVHPLALASPFLAAFDLPARGVTLKVPEVSYANPLPGGHGGRLSRPRPHVRGADATAIRGGACSARSSAATTVCVKLLLGDKRSIPPDPIAAVLVATAAARTGHPGVARTLRRRCPRAVHRCCCTYDFADAVAGVRRCGPDAGHPGAHRRLADSGGRQPGHPRRADRRPARARRHHHGRRGDHRTARRCGAFRHRSDRAAGHLPRQGARPIRKGVAALPLRARAWQRWTSCCPTKSHGRIRGRPTRRHCTWAAAASTWRTPNGRSPRADMRNGRWCSPPCHTWPTRAASMRRAAGRCGRTRMCRRVRPSTRPRR